MPPPATTAPVRVTRLLRGVAALLVVLLVVLLGASCGGGSGGTSGGGRTGSDRSARPSTSSSVLDLCRAFSVDDVAAVVGKTPGFKAASAFAFPDPDPQSAKVEVSCSFGSASLDPSGDQNSFDDPGDFTVTFIRTPDDLAADRYAAEQSVATDSSDLGVSGADGFLQQVTPAQGAGVTTATFTTGGRLWDLALTSAAPAPTAERQVDALVHLVLARAGSTKLSSDDLTESEENPCNRISTDKMSIAFNGPLETSGGGWSDAGTKQCVWSEGDESVMVGTNGSLGQSLDDERASCTSLTDAQPVPVEGLGEGAFVCPPGTYTTGADGYFQLGQDVWTVDVTDAGEDPVGRLTSLMKAAHAAVS